MNNPPRVRPCGACAHNHRKCQSGCHFRPYFPPNQEGKRNFRLLVGIYSRVYHSTMVSVIPVDRRQHAIDNLIRGATIRFLNRMGVMQTIGEL